MFATLLIFDEKLFHLINQDWTNSAFDWFFPNITDLHRDPRMLFVLIPILAIWIWKRRALALKSIFAIGLTILLCDTVAYRGIKSLVQRPRPPDAGISLVLRTTRYSGFSFPSNHAANMFGAATILSFVVPGAGVITFPIAALIAYSRVYVGVHFPIDVIAGAALGWLMAYLVWRLLRGWIYLSRKKNSPFDPSLQNSDEVNHPNETGAKMTDSSQPQSTPLISTKSPHSAIPTSTAAPTHLSHHSPLMAGPTTPKKVLVTGATGFLGNWLVKRLVLDGHHVRILKRASTPLEEIESLAIEVAIGDVTQLESVEKASVGIDTVFHLAGLIAYSRAQRDAMDKVNIGGTANVIQACEKNRVRRLIYLSSVVAIGASFDGKPMNEDSDYNVAHLNLGYFETKHLAEALVKHAVEAGKIDAVMINPSTIYGPGDSKKGSRGVQLKVARGKFPFYPSGGVNIVSVDDVVDCIVAAWERGRKGERYIVSGENLLIHEAFDLIAKAAGVKAPALPLPNALIHLIGKIGDTLEKFGKKGSLTSENAWTSTLYHWFDSSKAQREFGFKPKPAAFAIEQSVKWSREHGLLS